MVKQSLFFVKARELKVEPYENDDEPSESEVLIKTNSCGICGSDLHWHLDGSLGPFVMPPNIVPGHEASGVVLKIGSKVTNVKVGDRVCMEPCVPCWTCDLCRIGSNNLCHSADTNCCGFGRTGFFRTTNTWPAILCHKLPESMSIEEGALVEPTACVLWGVQRTGLKGGEKVLVTGAGPIGLLTMMAVKAYGASKVCILDISETRVNLARELGADHALQVDPKMKPEDVAELVIKEMGGPPDVTIECTGTGSCTNTGILAVRRGGKVTLMGLGAHSVNVNLSTASLRQVDLVAVARYNNTFPAAIELIASGKINAKALVSHVFKLDDYQKAFDTLLKGQGVKVLFRLDEEYSETN